MTLNNVSFSRDQAIGGAGNAEVYSFSPLDPGGSYGGGGGLGGDGGSYQLGSGGGGGIGAGPEAAGIVPGAPGGGASGSTHNVNSVPGGTSAGGGGTATSGSFAAGGGGGAGGGAGSGDPSAGTSHGGAGGFGGGGGGGSGPGGATGGNGGFGGGGGSGGGNGGFGGGGADGGVGGFGGGNGATGIVPGSLPGQPVFEGGGGLGAGGAVFVETGGVLTIQGGAISGNAVSAGLAGTTSVFAGATNGQALGSGIYLNDSGLSLSAAAGQTTTISDAIAYDPGLHGSDLGFGDVFVSGPGTVLLSGVNTFTGRTYLRSGTLELASPTAAGVGQVYLAPDSGSTLRLDAGAFDSAGLFPTMVTDFQGDDLDLPDLAYAPGATAVAFTTGPSLTVTSNGVTRQIAFTYSGNNTPFETFRTSSDGRGGTLVEEVGGPIIVGSGPNTIAVGISEDAYLGDAQFTVAVDGVQVGGVQTALVTHASGASEFFFVEGNFGSPGTPHQVTVNFLNDAYGGSPSTDRNLYVNSISGLGLSYGNVGAQLASAGPFTFSVDTPIPTGPTTVGSGLDSFVLDVSCDQYTPFGGQDGLGDPLFQITVDGVQVGPLQTATALHALGKTQNFTVQGDFGPGPHTVGVNFVNDAYGSPDYAGHTDRNLYIDDVVAGGQSYGSLALFSDGTKSVTVRIPPRIILGSGPDTIALGMSEDAYLGDAQFTVRVNGIQIGGVQTATARHSTGPDQLFEIKGAFGTAPQSLEVAPEFRTG